MGGGIIQVRPDRTSDPDGSRMSRFLVAHLMLERAVARRVALVHLVAILGAPLFICAAVHSLHRGLPVTLAMFGTAVGATLWALHQEQLHRRAARAAARGVEVNTIDPAG